MTIMLKLPEALEEYIAIQVAEGPHATVEEFIQHVLLEYQKRQGRKKIEALIREALDSGPPIPVTPAYWEERERQLLERYPEANEE